MRNLADAIRAIDMIVQQGEGLLRRHFKGVVQNLRTSIVSKRSRRALLWSYIDWPRTEYSVFGRPIPFDSEGGISIATNCRIDDLPTDSRAQRRAQEFSGLYAATLSRWSWLIEVTIVYRCSP